ncbi:MAG TPA: TonB-dependent receptor [Burkholderiaceae bacterium]|nr:TonB-dependent receptor [Burkholderiaceae bacterium]
MKCPRGRDVLAAACISSALTGPAAAQPVDPVRLQDVVVTASRSDVLLADMPLYTTIIHRQDIERSPAQTLDQLLRQIPGVNLGGAPYFVTDPTGNQIRMRGTTNSKVLVLLDGMPVLDPFYTTVQWFKVPLTSIERVEVIRGGNSSLWGNMAVAGVVNIVSRVPRDNGGAGSATYGSMNTATGSASKNFRPNDALGINVSADLLKTAGYQTTPSEYLSSFPGKGDSSATIWNARLGFYFDPTPDLSAYIRGGYHQQDQDIGGYTYGTNLQKSPDIAAGLTKSFGDSGQLSMNAWMQYVGFDKNNGAACYLQSATNCNTTAVTAPLVQYANSHDWNPYREVGASGVYALRLGSWLRGLQLGVDYRMLFGQDYSTTYNRPTTTDGAATTINRTNFGQGQQQFSGVFAQFQMLPLENLQVTLGVRYDYWTNTEGVALMTRYSGGKPGATLGGDVPDSNKGQFDPALAARYAVSEDIDIRGAVYKSFRAPGLNNLYRSFSSTTSITIANPFLFPETMTGGEIGGDFRTAKMEVNATAFIYDIQNLIASYRVLNAATAPPQVIAICGPTLANCPATVNFNTNAQDGRSYGLELAGRYNLTPTISADAAYMYTRSYYTASSVGDPLGNQLGAVPTNLFTAGLTWQTAPAWQNFIGLRYTGGMYLDVNHTIPQGGFVVVNLSTSYRVNSNIELFGNIVNLFNEKYSDSATTSASSKTLGMPFALNVGVRGWF